MEIDNYCVMLALVIFLLMYYDNMNNIESFSLNEAAPVGESNNELVKDLPKLNEVKPNGIIDTAPQQQQQPKPIGQVPRKVEMRPPVSMMGSMEVLQGAPIQGGDYMLLSADMMPGSRTVDSAVPMAYPRVGGVGNIGKDSLDIQEPEPGTAHPGGGDPVGGVHRGRGAAVGGVAVGGADVGGKKKGSIKIVIIYAPWCGWSKKSLNDFEKMKDNLNLPASGATNGYDVSCELFNSEEPNGKQKAKEYEVKGFPSVFVEVNGDRKDGPREYSKMVDMVNSITGGNINA